MTEYLKCTKDGMVEMTEAEVAQRKKDEADFENNLPMKRWLDEMAESDALMSRDIENVWDALGIQNAPDEVKLKHSKKKELRSKKPKGE